MTASPFEDPDYKKWLDKYSDHKIVSVVGSKVHGDHNHGRHGDGAGAESAGFSSGKRHAQAKRFSHTCRGCGGPHTHQRRPLNQASASEAHKVKDTRSIELEDIASLPKANASVSCNIPIW